jgi:hypothetical protein
LGTHLHVEHPCPKPCAKKRKGKGYKTKRDAKDLDATKETIKFSRGDKSRR